MRCPYRLLRPISESRSSAFSSSRTLSRPTLMGRNLACRDSQQKHRYIASKGSITNSRLFLTREWRRSGEPHFRQTWSKNIAGTNLRIRYAPSHGVCLLLYRCVDNIAAHRKCFQSHGCVRAGRYQADTDFVSVPVLTSRRVAPSRFCSNLLFVSHPGGRPRRFAPPIATRSRLRIASPNCSCSSRSSVNILVMSMISPYRQLSRFIPNPQPGVCIP